MPTSNFDAFANRILINIRPLTVWTITHGQEPGQRADQRSHNLMSGVSRLPTPALPRALSTFAPSASLTRVDANTLELFFAISFAICKDRSGCLCCCRAVLPFLLDLVVESNVRMNPPGIPNVLWTRLCRSADAWFFVHDGAAISCTASNFRKIPFLTVSRVCCHNGNGSALQLT